MKIIAFGHRKFVGKDTAARFLATWLRLTKPGVSISVVGFADPIKEITYTIYKWADLQPGWYYEDNPKMKDVILPKIGKSPRQIWIDFGNAIRDKVYEPTWAEFLFNNHPRDYLIIKDLRFPTEAKFVSIYKGYNIEIQNPRIEQVNDGADDQLIGYDGWYKTIINDSDFNVLNNRIIELGKEIC